MSVTCKKINEPRLDIADERTYVAVIGGSKVTSDHYNASSASRDSISFNCATPSIHVGVDRRVILETEFRVSCSNCILNADILTSDSAGFRQFPLWSICSNLMLKLNDQAFSMQPADHIHSLMNYNNDAIDRKYWFAGQPSKPDIRTSYSTTGSSGSRNPFTSYAGSELEEGRAFSTWISGNDDTSFTVRLFCPLMISPLNFTRTQVQCLFGIQNISVILTLNNNQRFVSGVNGTLFGTASAAPPQTASLFLNPNGSPAVPTANDLIVLPTNASSQILHVTYVSPQPDQIPPSILSYGYHDLSTHTRDVGQFTEQQQRTLTFSGIQLGEIPKRIFIYAKRPNSQNLIFPDTFLKIDRVSINFNNEEGRLSSMNSYDLFDIATKNGYNRSFMFWDKFGGSVLCIEPGRDISLAPLLSEGVRGSYNISASVTFTDPRITGAVPDQEVGALDYTMFMIFVRSGVMTIDNQLVGLSIGPLTEQILAESSEVSKRERPAVHDFYQGSGFFKDFVKGIKKVASLAAPLLSLIPDRRAQMGSQVARAISGLGRGRGGAKARRNSLKLRL